MSYNSLFKETPRELPVPAPPADDQNPALVDALKTFRITAISAGLFIGASILIILATRMG